MNTELGEPQAFAGFDVALFRPSRDRIEAFELRADELPPWFEAHGCERVDEGLFHAPANGYFRPIGARIPGRLERRGHA